MTAYTGEIFTGPAKTGGAQGSNAQINLWNPLFTVKYYKMCGYYVAGSVFEVWISTGTISSTPPSGHTLTNVFVVASWSV